MTTSLDFATLESLRYRRDQLTTASFLFMGVGVLPILINILAINRDVLGLGPRPGALAFVFMVSLASATVCYLLAQEMHRELIS